MTSALGMVSSEVKQNVQESGHKLLGPGRFGMASISHQNWLQKMLRDPLTEEEQAFMDKQDEENQMDDSEVSERDINDEMSDVFK